MFYIEECKFYSEMKEFPFVMSFKKVVEDIVEDIVEDTVEDNKLSRLDILDI